MICAPESVELNTAFEIREIQQKHRITILSGVVTKSDVYRTCRSNAFDVLHFAGHGGAEGVLLSYGELLTPPEIGQLCRMSHTRLIFFNSCETGVPATYATRHGAEMAFFAIRKLPDEDAWKLPLVFYNSIADGANDEIITAFMVADGGEATYSLVVAPTFIQSMLTLIKDWEHRFVTLEKKLAETEMALLNNAKLRSQQLPINLNLLLLAVAVAVFVGLVTYFVAQGA